MDGEKPFTVLATCGQIQHGRVDDALYGLYASPQDLMNTELSSCVEMLWSYVSATVIANATHVSYFAHQADHNVLLCVE